MEYMHRRHAMRLFIAVNFDMETRNRLMAVQDRL